MVQGPVEGSWENGVSLCGGVLAPPFLVVCLEQVTPFFSFDAAVVSGLG